MREARISQGELHGAASYDISMPMTGEREFRVTGRLSDDAPDTVNLRLRIQQQDGQSPASASCVPLMCMACSHGACPA